MNGFTGFETATTEELPDAVAVTDPFYVVRLAGTPWISTDAMPSSTPAGSAAQGRPALLRTPHSAHGCRPTHRQAVPAAGVPVRGQGARPGRSDLGDLPAHDRRLPRARPEPWTRADAED